MRALLNTRGLATVKPCGPQRCIEIYDEVAAPAYEWVGVEGVGNRAPKFVDLREKSRVKRSRE